jgi:general secretion pathway protein B
MSFILDALKKSEAERRQGEVPRLQNEPFSPPPRRRPVLPLLLVLALALNGVVFGWWLLSREKQPVPVATVGSGPEQSAADGRTARAESGSLPATATAEPATSSGEPVATGAQLSLSADVQQRATTPAPPSEPEVVTVVIEETPAPPAASAARPAAARTVEKETQARRTETPAAASAKTKVATAAPAADSFPPVSELPGNVRSGLPRLDLQLHFFTPDPERRLVRLNGLNLRQGGSSGDGLNVVEITQDGVKLSYGGNRFFLPTGRP